MVYICICTMVSKIPQQKRWEVIYFPTVFPWSTPLPPMRLLLNALWKSSTVKSSMVLVRTQNIVVFIGPQKKKNQGYQDLTMTPRFPLFHAKESPLRRDSTKEFQTNMSKTAALNLWIELPFHSGHLCKTQILTL